MDDRDFYALAGLVGALAVVSILHTRLIAKAFDALVELHADIEFLKDNTVARETEARP